MDLQQRINAFVQLGKFLGQFSSEEAIETPNIPANDDFILKMKSVIRQAALQNGWFTEENLRYTFRSWSQALTKESIEQWLSPYEIKDEQPKTIAIVMAGNIPLVGFHDFLSVLITGNKVLAKLSSNDTVLLRFIANYLTAIAPDFKNRITFTEGRVSDFDAVIATGSNNTAKHFSYYFGKYPNIIRKNRNSVAVLSGSETSKELERLSHDIFQYFGLGCRNVSKIYVPKGYDFDNFFNAMYSKKEYINNHKYINNYDYNKAVYLMSNIKLLDNEYMLLKEDTGYSSPISVVFYEYYETVELLQKKLAEDSEKIQAIVSNIGLPNEVPFGHAQAPNLWDYADRVDTIKFLLELE